jgi:hypothetical protein
MEVERQSRQSSAASGLQSQITSPALTSMLHKVCLSQPDKALGLIESLPAESLLSLEKGFHWTSNIHGLNLLPFKIRLGSAMPNPASASMRLDIAFSPILCGGKTYKS